MPSRGAQRGGTAYVAAAALLLVLGLCNGTRTTEGQEVVREVERTCVETREDLPLREELPLVLARLRRQAAAAASPEKLLAGQASGEVNSPTSQLAAFGEQLRSQGDALGKQIKSQSEALGEQLRSQSAAAVQQTQNFGSQLAANVGSMFEKQAPKRNRRQISYPSPDGVEQKPAPAADKSGQTGGGFMKYLADLGQQAQKAQAVQQFISAASGSGTQRPDNPLASLAQSTSALSTSSSSSSPSGFNVGQMMAQLTDLIKSTQDRNSRVLENNQQALSSASQQAVEGANNAQGGIQSALSEMGQGFQRLAANNPNLLPEIMNLYKSVSSKLMSAFSPAQQAPGTNLNQPPSLPVAQP